MKKSVMLAVVIGLLCFSTTSYAKNINKGTIEVGGGLGFLMDSLEFDPDGEGSDLEQDETEFSVNALYYIRPNIGIGGTWEYETKEIKEGRQKTEKSLYKIGPMASYNVSMDKQISFKLQGAILKYASEDESSGMEREGFLWQARGMASYFILKNVSINGSLAYTFGEIEQEEQGYDDVDWDVSHFTSRISISVYLN